MYVASPRGKKFCHTTTPKIVWFVSPKLPTSAYSKLLSESLPYVKELKGQILNLHYKT